MDCSDKKESEEAALRKKEKRKYVDKHNARVKELRHIRREELMVKRSQLIEDLAVNEEYQIIPSPNGSYTEAQINKLGRLMWRLQNLGLNNQEIQSVLGMSTKWIHQPENARRVDMSTVPTVLFRNTVITTYMLLNEVIEDLYANRKDVNIIHLLSQIIPLAKSFEAILQEQDGEKKPHENTSMMTQAELGFIFNNKRYPRDEVELQEWIKKDGGQSNVVRNIKFGNT